MTERPKGRGARAWLVGRPPVGAFWGWAQVALAKNAGTTLAQGTALVLSPHPDDETIGCGLLLARLARDGSPAAVGLATDGREGWFSVAPRPSADRIADVRIGEWHGALDALKVRRDRRFALRLPDGTLEDREDDVTAWITELLLSVSPSRIFVTRGFDEHPDHRTLFRAARRAVIATYGRRFDRDAASGGVSPVDGNDPPPEIYTYRVYPVAGLWPDGRPSRVTLSATLVQFARSVFGLVGRRPLALRAPRCKPEKRLAVEAYESQRKLLNGELRYVWRTGVELYWKADVFSDSTSARPGRSAD